MYDNNDDDDDDDDEKPVDLDRFLYIYKLNSFDR